MVSEGETFLGTVPLLSDLPPYTARTNMADSVEYLVGALLELVSKIVCNSKKINPQGLKPASLAALTRHG